MMVLQKDGLGEAARRQHTMGATWRDDANRLRHGRSHGPPRYPRIRAGVIIVLSGRAKSRRMSIGDQFRRMSSSPGTGAWLPRTAYGVGRCKSYSSAARGRDALPRATRVGEAKVLLLGARFFGSRFENGNIFFFHQNGSLVPIFQAPKQQLRDIVGPPYFAH